MPPVHLLPVVTPTKEADMEELGDANHNARPASADDNELHHITSPVERHQYGRSMSTTLQNKINESHFAGRIGGNQLFTAPVPDTAHPDATGDSSWSSLLDPRGFRELFLWKMAIIEGVGTSLQVYITGLFGVGILPSVTETSVGPVFPVTYAAIVNFLVISLFIFGTGPVTGAHFNPLITMGTFCCKLSSMPRTVLYITFQCIGAVIGGFLLRASLGSRVPLAIMPGCYIDPTLVTPGEAYVLETVTSLFLIFLAFGLGLDPRNATAFGPSLGPFLIGMSSALCLFGSGFARKGYLGSSNNPARCLGLMSAGQRFTYHYIHWVGPITAAV
jgi:glycerol uptake facilitator-like aquaporin